MAELIMQEETSTPAAPSTNKWKVYFKSDGLYIIDDLGGVTGPFEQRSSLKSYFDSLYIYGFIPGGRLTLGSGIPVTITDATGATVLYYTPYTHDKITIWNGSTWQSLAFTETSLSLGTMTSGLPYDVFGYISGGALALEKLAWTNGSTRATGISLQDGRYCKTGDKTRLYLGTFYTTSTTTTEDSEAKRYLFNMYNRASRKCLISSASSHTYATATWRQWNNSTANQFSFICGVADQSPTILHKAVMSGATGGQTSIGFDQTTAVGSAALDSAVASQQQYSSFIASPATFPAGFHFVAALQIGATTVTFAQFNLMMQWMC